jgi:flagellum-specific peptidoglycan hydrolase FlgJ
MSTGSKFGKISFALVLSVAVLCPNWSRSANAETTHRQRKAKKQQQQLPPLPSGPTGPVQQLPLDKIAAVPPDVTYQNNQLTIVAPNSTLGDILRAVRKLTGAEIDIPPAPERVVTRLGPGPARDVVAELLNGSRFNYVLLGSPQNDAVLTRVVLVQKSGPDTIAPNPTAPGSQPGLAQVSPAAVQPETPAEATEPEANEDNTNNAVDENATEQQPAAEGEQPANSSDQQAIKTPQQMLQEMQQRQMQLQQQQQGQPQPAPGSGMPPHPPQEP